jgi:hypothetical protein
MNPTALSERAHAIVDSLSPVETFSEHVKARSKLHEAILALCADVERAALERAAEACDAMVIGGRAWTHDQEVAAEVLAAASTAIRALKSAAQEEGKP